MPVHPVRALLFHLFFGLASVGLAAFVSPRWGVVLFIAGTMGSIIVLAWDSLWKWRSIAVPLTFYMSSLLLVGFVSWWLATLSMAVPEIRASWGPDGEVESKTIYVAVPKGGVIGFPDPGMFLTATQMATVDWWLHFDQGLDSIGLSTLPGYTSEVHAEDQRLYPGRPYQIHFSASPRSLPITLSVKLQVYYHGKRDAPALEKHFTLIAQQKS